jgi:hypothetical protein
MLAETNATISDYSSARVEQTKVGGALLALVKKCNPSATRVISLLTNPC